MNLEIGSDRLRTNHGKEWHTLDCMDSADIVHDLNMFPYPINSNTYDYIYMSHVLEHISWTYTDIVLKELYRILKPEGKFEVHVPDLGKLIKGYQKKEMPGKWCYANSERNYMKWFNGRMFSYGGIENQHKSCYDFHYLKSCLENAGFRGVKRTEKNNNHGYINLGMEGRK